MSRLLVMLCVNLCISLINYDMAAMEKKMALTFPSSALLKQKLIQAGLNESLAETLGLHNCLGGMVCTPQDFVNIINCAYSRCCARLKESKDKNRLFCHINPKFALMHTILKDNKGANVIEFRLEAFSLSMQDNVHNF